MIKRFEDFEKMNEDFEDIQIFLKGNNPAEGFANLTGWILDTDNEEVNPTGKKLLTLRLDNKSKMISLDQNSVKVLIAKLQELLGELK